MHFNPPPFLIIEARMQSDAPPFRSNQAKLHLKLPPFSTSLTKLHDSNNTIYDHPDPNHPAYGYMPQDYTPPQPSRPFSLLTLWDEAYGEHYCLQQHSLVLHSFVISVLHNGNLGQHTSLARGMNYGLAYCDINTSCSTARLLFLSYTFPTCDYHLRYRIYETPNAVVKRFVLPLFYLSSTRSTYIYMSQHTTTVMPASSQDSPPTVKSAGSHFRGKSRKGLERLPVGRTQPKGPLSNVHLFRTGHRALFPFLLYPLSKNSSLLHSLRDCSN